MATETWEAQATRFAIHTRTLRNSASGTLRGKWRRAPQRRIIENVFIDTYDNYYNMFHMLVKPNTAYGGRFLEIVRDCLDTTPRVGTRRRNEVNLL